MSTKKESTVYHRKCIICGKEFDTVRKRQVCCGSRECRNKRISQRNKARREERRENPKIYHKICAVCGAPFTSQRSNAMYCSKECRSRGRYLDSYNGGRKFKPRKCCICGTVFIPRSGAQVTCRDPECQLQRYYQTRRSNYTKPTSNNELQKYSVRDFLRKPEEEERFNLKARNYSKIQIEETKQMYAHVEIPPELAKIDAERKKKAN